jgi:hypothetical protein
LVSTVKKIIAMLLVAAFVFTCSIGCESGDKKPDAKKTETKKDEKKS